MNRLVGGDRYDLAALICVLLGVVLAVTVGPWYLWLLIGFAIGNVLSAALRRRAGVPDRSALGRLRGGPAPPSGSRRRKAPPARGTEAPATDPPPARARQRRAGTEWREGRRRSR